MKLFLVVLGLLATSVMGYPSSSEGDAAPAEADPPSSEEEPLIHEDLPSPLEEDVPESFRGTNYTTVDDDDDAPAVSEEALDVDALKTLLTEFTSANTGFSTTELVKKLDDLEKNIKKSITKFQGTLEQERNKLSQLSALSQQVSSLKNSFTELDNRMKAFAAGAENLGKPEALIPSPSGLTGFGERQEAWATLYRSRGHGGRSTLLDFRSCYKNDACCKNLEDLDNDTQSIHTHDTCVTMYKDRNCAGDSRDYYPGSPANHQDFASYNDVFSSGKPCSKRA